MGSGGGSNSDRADIRPFLRWAGSKRKLLKHLEPYIPKTYNRYFEPFLGGGSLFFYLQPSHAELSDASAELIKTYRAVKKDPEGVLSYLSGLKPTRENFERIKRSQPRTPKNAAGRFIFLNKTCWNGLYRVNSKGIFNVPYGMPKSDNIIDKNNFRQCAQALRRRSVRILCQDFEKIEKRVAEGDFVFLDPPYITSHNINGFADWNERLFSWEDQKRLAAFAKRIVEKGANVLITNANHPDVKALYPSFGIDFFTRSSTLASDKARRCQTSEAIFFGGAAYSDNNTGWSQGYAGTKYRGNRPTQRL